MEALKLIKSPDQTLVIDPERFRVSFENQTITTSLTLTEFRLLSLLVERSGCVNTRQQIINDIAPGHKIIERNVDVHVRSLRKKLGAVGENLETIHGLGYRWR